MLSKNGNFVIWILKLSYLVKWTATLTVPPDRLDQIEVVSESVALHCVLNLWLILINLDYNKIFISQLIQYGMVWSSDGCFILVAIRHSNQPLRQGYDIAYFKLLIGSHCGSFFFFQKEWLKHFLNNQTVYTGDKDLLFSLLSKSLNRIGPALKLT